MAQTSSRYDPKAAYDGFTTITKGVHSAVAPIALPRNQLAWAVNVDCRSDFMRPRPGWVKHPLTFTAEEYIPATGVQALFESGIFQGAIVFERFSQIVTMIGGRLFRIDPLNWNVADISTPGDLNPSNLYRAWFCEAESWVIAQDGVSIPWIYDGASTVRSDTLGAGGKVQVPIGKAMCYAQGRLHVSYASGRAFVIGDIVGGDSGTAPYDFKDSVLYFTENAVINGGGSFSIPINAGLITAFRPIAQIDTSMGQGPTQVFTTNAIFSLNLPTDRATWADVNFPIGTVSNVANGATSDRCAFNVNGDIWFRAPDGIRSFLVARRDFQSAWVNAPLSHEVERAVSTDDVNLLDYASGIYYDTRSYLTAHPYRVWEHGIAHQGLLQLDFEPVTSLGERNPLPVWLGNATGVRVLQILTGNIMGVPRCFMFGLSGDNKIELWEVTRKAPADNNGSASIPIEWTFETAAFSFMSDNGAGANPSIAPGRELWSLDGGRLYVDDIEGDVSFTLQFRPDQDACWHDWHSWSVCANDTTCGTGGGCLATPPNLRPQYRKPFFLPQPRAGCDATTNKPYHIGREFQVRGVVVGHCRIKMLELVAHAQEDDVSGLCAASEVCVSVACCEPNDYSYAIPPAPTPPPVARGACCINGICGVMTEAQCANAGGTYHGDDTTCTTDLCGTPPPTPTGACLIDGVCSITTEDACVLAGGTYQGNGTTCDGPAPATGACCIDQECHLLSLDNCLNAGGIYRGDLATCPDVICAVGMPTPAPAWPVPAPYACPGRGTFSPITITDPSDGSGFVAINPGAGDPNAYLAFWGEPGCLESWCAEVWAQFVASGTPYSAARFIWDSATLTGGNFQATQVFPHQAGGYGRVIDLNTFITVEYCPP